MYLHPVHGQLRHFQVIRGLHGNADVADQLIDLLLRALPQLIRVHDLPVPLIRHKELFPVVGHEPTKALPHVQQVHLRPQVDQGIGRGRAGQPDHPAAQGAHLFERLEPLCLGQLEGGQLVNHQRVKAPCGMLHQPADIFPVDDIDHGFPGKRRPALLFAAHHQRVGQPLQMFPLGNLPRPCVLGHALGSNHQHTAHIKAVQQQIPQCRQRNDALAQPKPISRIRPQYG